MKDELENGDDGVERGAELVSHRGEEVLLDSLGLLLDLLEPSDITADYNQLAVAIDELSLDLNLSLH